MSWPPFGDIDFQVFRLGLVNVALPRQDAGQLADGVRRLGLPGAVGAARHRPGVTMVICGRLLAISFCAMMPCSISAAET